MTIASAVITTGSVAAAGFALGSLILAAYPPERAPFTAPERAAAMEPVVISARDVPQVWPAAFGTVPEAAPEPAPDPQPRPVAEAEPEENTTYWLTGLVTGRGNEGWAMIAENDHSVVVRVGDVLVGGETVTAIDGRGVWISHQGTTELIARHKTDFGAILARPASDAANTAPEFVGQVTVPVEAADGDYIASLFADAGRLVPVQGAAGGLTVAVLRKGGLLDQLGLREGDTILSINGAAPVAADLLGALPRDALGAGALDLEILRDGARQVVRVTFDQG